MADTPTCPTCATPLPPDAADAACPKCAQPPSTDASATGVPGPAAAPPAGPARTSPLAVAGVLLGAAGVVAIVAGIAIARSVEPTGASSSALIAFTGMPVVAVLALLAGLAVSVFAWIQIRNSNGALRGVPWAATGTFLPVVVLCLCASKTLVRDDGPVPGLTPAPKPSRSYFAAESADGAAIKIAPDEERRIDELWRRAQRLPATPKLSDTEGLYSAEDVKVLESLKPDGLAKDARAGEYGLPLLPRDVLSCPDLETYSLTRVRFGAPIPSNRVPADSRAVATATDGRRVIRFVLTRAGPRSEWYFAPYKVELE